jgi:hypothetical protein
MKNMKYYHITHPENARSILKNGIISNSDGEIFLFENKSIAFNNIINTVADSIAHNQLLLKQYSMFEVDISGLTNQLLQDNVGELTSCFQWILLNQKVILPQYIDYFGTFDTSFISVYRQWYSTN